VLRKDFTVSEADVCDARIMGADAVLLIVAALTDGELSSFLALAGRLGLTALVEVHDASELDRALQAGATVIGVNQRNLRTFEVDHDLALTLAEAFPDGIVGVAESGIRGADDAARLADAGYHAVLVGETLVRSNDRRASVQALVGARQDRVHAGAKPGAPDRNGANGSADRSSMTRS
jgi:indole-3-glycerol phosphate synthase